MADRILFQFPGQGSQAVGMGGSLAAAFPEARKVFEEVNDALGEDLFTLMQDGPEDELRLTRNAQPALFAASMAGLAVLRKATGREIDTLTDFVAGHSLGEYSALAAAGTLSIADAARLLRLRGDSMQSAVPAGEGAMAAIAATHDVTPGMAQSVLGALEAWGDVITLEGDLWMRPGTDIDEIPPAMLHAAGMAPFPPMLGGPIASQVQMAQRQAAAAALAHALGLQQPFPHGQPPGGR